MKLFLPLDMFFDTIQMTKSRKAKHVKLRDIYFQQDFRCTIKYSNHQKRAHFR